MKKLFTVLITVFLLLVSSISYAGDPALKEKDMNMARGKYMQKLPLEQANKAVEMTEEIYDYLDSVDINDFYVKESYDKILNGIFPIVKKYKNDIPLVYVDWYLYINKQTCELRLVAMFTYNTFTAGLAFKVHRIQGIEPKCPEKQPDATL